MAAFIAKQMLGSKLDSVKGIEIAFFKGFSLCYISKK